MADLEVEVKLDKGATGPFVAIDSAPVPLTPKGDGAFKGTATATGTDGDGSVHCLLFSWTGPAGATMGIEIHCAGKQVAKSGPLAISVAAAPYGGSRKYFAL